MSNPVRRPSDVPRHIVAALNRGKRESQTLAEWLAVDIGSLFDNVTRDLRRQGIIEPSLVSFPTFEGGVTKKLALAGTLLAQVDDCGAIAKYIGDHPSDVVRQWGSYMIASDRTLPFSARLDATRRFAADRNMSVREVAWMTLRPYIAAELAVAIVALEHWVRDPDPNIRRCAVEGTRPRSVWGQHIPELKRSPELGEGLLENVCADSSRYVQLAVGNWLNDASKTRPDWVRRTTARWARDTYDPATKFIVRRGLRTISR
jgi:3-methyladenine DNA glycosylase AlkC